MATVNVDSEVTRIMLGVNESRIKGYPHASISSKSAFEWTLNKIIRSNTSGFKLLFLHVQVPDEDEFEDARDAEDAIRGRDGYKFDGHRLRVELAHGGRVSSSTDRHSSGGSRGGLSRRSDYRVYVTGLPSSASWQDLKDHMRRAGDVCFSQVFRDRDGMRGIVDYTNYDDMKYAIRKLDDSLFRNQFSKAYERVEEYDRRQDYSRSPSRSPYYSRSRSPSRSRSYDSRSRSYSPREKYSRRSRSRSISSRSRYESSASPASRCGFHGVPGNCIVGS